MTASTIDTTAPAITESDLEVLSRLLELNSPTIGESISSCRSSAGVWRGIKNAKPYAVLMEVAEGRTDVPVELAAAVRACLEDMRRGSKAWAAEEREAITQIEAGELSTLYPGESSAGDRIASVREAVAKGEHEAEVCGRILEALCSSTPTPVRVPVRTWQQKAILAAAIGSPLANLHEQRDPYLGSIAELLHDPEAVDRAIDEYERGRAAIKRIEEGLAQLRAITPGPAATLQLPEGLAFSKELDDLVDDLARLDVSEYNGLHATQRQIAEATIVAIDLRNEIRAARGAEEATA